MTMQINRDNYGAFFLDYWESNLDEQGRSALTIFLDKNPDLLDEFLDFKSAAGLQYVPGKAPVFKQKHKLKKLVVKPVGAITQDNYETFIIASLENDLDQENRKDFEKFVKQNPGVEGEIALYKKTFLKPDSRIILETKSGLKRPAIPFWRAGYFKRAVSIAAMLAIAVGLFRLSTLMFTTDGTILETAQAPTQHEVFGDNRQTVQVNPVAPLLSDFTVNPLTSISALTVDNPVHRALTNLIDDAGLFDGSSEIAINSLAIRQFSTAISNAPRPFQPETRNDFTPVFDYLLIRDGIAFEAEKQQNVFNRLIAGVGDLLGIEREQPMDQFVQPVFDAITDRGRDLITIAGDSFPVYRTTDESGRKEVYFALNDNFNILLSRGKPVTE